MSDIGQAGEVTYLPDMTKHPKRPKDSAALAKLVVDIASGAVRNDPVPTEPNARAVKRGLARAESLTATQRRAIAKKAANARWNKDL